MPAFLSHVPYHAYIDHGNGTHSTSYSPDYAHADLRTALRNFIAALGARYDGDPRIGFITVGLLGFWGEWHTWPHEDWMASVTVMNEVLDAYGTAFDETRLLVREPKDGTGMGQRRLGFHDDSFAYSTGNPPDLQPDSLSMAIPARKGTGRSGGGRASQGTGGRAGKGPRPPGRGR